MPVMNGIGAARKISAIAPKTVTILFTSHASDYLSKLAASIGIKDVLSKDSKNALSLLVTTLKASLN